MSWLSDQGTREAVIDNLPEAAPLFADFYRSFWRQPYLEPATLELCRLRLAQLHQSDVEWQRSEHPVDDSKKAELNRWDQSSVFNPAEKACLEYTEVYAMDPAAITDELAADIKTHYGEAGLVTLGTALGIFYGLTRMSLMWQLSSS